MKVYFSLISLVLVLGFLLAGCAGSSGKVAAQPSTGSNQEPGSTNNNNVAAAASSNPPSSAPASASKNIEDGKAGTTYQVEYTNSKYEVTLVKTAFTEPSNPYVEGRYLMAYFEIKNIGEGSEYFSPDVYALDTSGEKYDKTIPIGLSDEYEKTLDFLKKLSPNTKMSGWVAIKVPKDLSSADLYFEYSNPILTKTPNYIKYRVSG